jgi:hypothetical protein
MKSGKMLEMPMKIVRTKRPNGKRIALTVIFLMALLACGQNPTNSAPTDKPPSIGGTYFGVNLDWDNLSPWDYNEALGHKAAVFVQFFQFPLAGGDFAYLDATVNAVAAQGGMLMITLEPWGGLDSVTPEAITALVEILAEYNEKGISMFVRFAHEMNGVWYPWSQQPTAYIKAFRMIAEAVHRDAPGTAMVWAPNYGGGYPFIGGPFEIKSDHPDFPMLDTNQDGKLDMNDDPYSPYYPGDDVVDWAGMTIYHWGNAYPWGENELPEENQFIDQLTGNYNGLNGDNSSLPDFYELFYQIHNKPIAIPETAALYNTARPDTEELTIKQAWWRQVLNAELLSAYPGIQMINWFEWKKPENEIGGNVIDWRALGSPEIAEQFKLDLPVDHLVFAP